MKNKDLHLLAYYAITPKNPQFCVRKGYIKDPNNINYEESINITRGLRDKDIASTSVILNLSQQKVVRNVFNDNRDFASLLAHFQQGYPQYINPVVAALYKDQLNEINSDVQGQKEENSGSQRAAKTNTIGTREGNETVAPAV